jgi:hypothetical protein
LFRRFDGRCVFVVCVAHDFLKRLMSSRGGAKS